MEMTNMRISIIEKQICLKCLVQIVQFINSTVLTHWMNSYINPMSWFFLDLLTRVLAALIVTIVYFSKGKNVDLLRERWEFETILSPIWQWPSSRKLALKVDIVNSLITGSLSEPCTPLNSHHPKHHVIIQGSNMTISWFNWEPASHKQF